MANIYLVLTATGTLVSRCIGLYTRARYNHVSLCLDPKVSEFYSFGRKIRWFPLIGGFVIEHIDSGMFKAYGETTCAIYRLEVTDEQFEVLEKEIVPFIKNKKSYGFNLIGLIGVMFNMPMNRKNKYFCTQFVAAMLQKSGIYDFKKENALVSPQDFYDIPELKPVFEGRLCDFGKSKALAVSAASAQ